MSTGIELHGDLYFCNCGYIGSEDLVTRVERPIKFSLYEEMFKDREFSMSGATVEKFFNEKSVNRRY